MYTLENIPELTKPLNLKLTPRSHEAFLRKGYTLDMIIKRSPEEINASFGDHITKESIVQKRFLHAEERRLARLD